MKLATLSKDLGSVIEKAEGDQVRFGDFVLKIGDKAFGVIIVLLAIPSALPTPAPFISTPFGLGIILIAAQLMIGRKALWLPKRVMDAKVSVSAANKMISALNWILEKCEWVIHPRLKWVSTRSGHILLGILMSCCALLMMIPFPLTNTLPAMVIFLLGVSLTEDDGLIAILASVIAVLVILAYIAGFSAVLFFGFQGLEQVVDYLKESLMH